MFRVTISVILAFIVPTALLVVSFVLRPSSVEQEKGSPFECGFDPTSSARLPFSLRFFLLAVLFLVFDVEIALLLPLPVAAQLTLTPVRVIGVALFVVVLLLGLVHEWREGSLN